MNPQMVMYEEEFNQIQVVDRLVKEANARVVHRRQERPAHRGER
jgi:hypothetical protein